MNEKHNPSRRHFIKHLLCGSATAAGIAGFPMLGCGRSKRMTIDFLTIPDSDGWHPSLRLKGDWLIIKISDGVLAGYGEASHSKQDEACREVAAKLFAERLVDFRLSFENLKALEQELMATHPDFVTATAWSGINQALYDLLAKREQVPVWQLFKNKAGLEKLELYTTINRSLRDRDATDYTQLVGEVKAQGFKTFKCAPFEKVTVPERGFSDSEAGLKILQMLRERFPELCMRVDFHERFNRVEFLKLVPSLETVGLDWIEEPFEMGDDYLTLKENTQIRLAAGELFWGRQRFQEIMENQWSDVIMPDVKHVGGFGPLLDVLEMGKGRIEISPHNPSGPISSAASIHAAALYPEVVNSLEFAFDRELTRRKYGERIEDGFLLLNDKPGWGIDAEAGA